MTAIVGVLCREGVVIGADSSATFSAGHQHTIEQPTEKLTIIHDAVIVVGTGQVGLGQRFRRIVEMSWENGVFDGRLHHIEIGKHLCREALGDFGSTRMGPGQFGALVAFSLGENPHLCEFASTDFQPEFKDKGIWYCSLGSGQPIADPFLGLMREVFWSAGPPLVQDGIFAVTWALQHVINLNPGGVNQPIRIAVLEKVEAGRFQGRMLDADELQEHYGNIEEAKRRLQSVQEDQQPTAAATPDIPRVELPRAVREDH